MKKGILLFVLSVICSMSFAQFQAGTQWNKVLSDRPETFQTQLISSTENSIQVNVQVPGFYTTSVTTPRGEANVITVPKKLSTAHAGEPDLPMTGIPLMIGDKARMKARVLEAQYMDFEGIEVAPSKGDFPRTIDPETVPYTYGECYSKDEFFPTSNLDLYEPYIIRDFRGQNMAVYPFAYNPVTKTLRVYYNMTVEMYKVDNKGENIIETRRSNEVKMDQDFKSIYERHFLNYEAASAKYTPITEDGDLLIICYDSYMNYMTDFVNWKKTRGINTTMVGTSTAGSTYSAIKTYIQNQYNANNNITHVLLVGDVGQIPGYSYSGGGSSYSGLGDNNYGQIVGSDIYNDVIIGRFSANSTSRVTTQCNRAITYERDLTTSASWLQVAQGISRKEGGSGHNNEDDYQHMDNIRTDLLNYGYTTVYQRYANLTGYTATSSQISSDINSGVGIINYANHGQETAWGANSSGYVYYANSHVNALTNDNKLPFIFSVACLVGKYDHSSDCFAEAWMNATNGSNPTGAIGTLMSYISQPWIPPMWGQDNCIDILTEQSNTKRTYGGISINGLMGIFDHYSTSEQQAVGTYQAWIVFGDPTLMVRTKTPTAMTVTHAGTITPSATSYAVTVSNGSGAVATITDANHNILGKATVSGTSVSIPISGTLTAGTELTLCVFGYNKVTYLGTISVNGGTQYTITAKASPTAGGTVSGAGTFYENSSCTLTATPNTGYTFTNWKKGNNVVSSNASYTFNVTSSTAGEYTATFTAIPQYTIAVQANPTAGGTVSGGGTYYEGASCTLKATPANHYEFVKWTKNGSQVSTNATYTFNVTANATYVANFNALTAHTVTCATVENGTISASPTTAYKGETVTLSATPASGFYFGSWTVKDANNNPIQVSNNQFTMPDSNVTVSATFVTGYNVTLASVSNGTISANPTYGPAGTTVNLTATPASGYSLDSWIVYRTDDMGTTVNVSGNSFTMPSFDVTVAAIFTSSSSGEETIGSTADNTTGWALPTHVYYGYSLTQQIYTSAEVGDAGTITAISFYYLGSSTSGSASSSGSRTFKIYMSNTSTSSLSNNWVNETTNHLVYSGTQTFQALGWYTFTLDTPFEYDGTSNLLLTFDDNTGSYSVSARRYFRTYSTGEARARYIDSDSNDFDPTAATSLTSNSGSYNTTATDNNIIKLTKTVASSNEAISVSPNALTGFTYPEGQGPSGAQTIDVIGRNLQNNLTVTAPTHFEVSGTANGTYGSTLSLTPTNGSVQTIVYIRLKSDLSQGSYNNESMTFSSGSASQTVTLSGNVSQGLGTYYLITATADPEAGGTVTGAGNFLEGAEVTLTATANAGYTFVNWTKNGTAVSTNPVYSFTANAAGAYVAHFSRNSYTITATANPAAGGTVTGAGTFYEGVSCTLTATANTGYTFVNWTLNGTAVSTQPNYTFNVTAGGSYVANFEAMTSHTVTLNQTSGGTITANPTTAYVGDVITLTVNANEGYFFVEWNVVDASNQSISVSNDNTFTMPNSDVTVTAVFTQGFVVTLSQTEHGTVSADHTTALQPGDIVTLTATPDSDCILLAWYVYKTGDPRAVISVVNNSYFVMPASDVTVMGVFVTTEQYEAQLGSGTSTNNYIPTYVRASYSLTQQIYLASELENKKGSITKIAFRATTASATRKLIIYMAHTDKSSFSSTTNWEVMGSVSKVFEGNVTFGTSDWTTITLDTPFEYDGESNLNLCVVDETGSASGSNNSYTKFYRYSATNRALYVNGSSSYASTVGYTSLSSTTGTRISYVNRINITMTLPGSAESLTLSPDALNGFNYEEGNGPSDIRKLGVVGVDLSNDITVSAPDNFEISLTGDTYTSSLTIPRATSKGRNVTTWSFEGTLDGWTVVDSDGDGYNWVLGSASNGVYLGNDDVMTEGHNSSTDMVVSGSWTNVSSKGSALTPDNWLISPQVTLGGSFSLWAQPYRANYPAEHFGIFVSTTDANPSSFTMLNEWTLSSSTWKQYSVDLSAYEGQSGYIAVRHFGMENNDQFLIKVDDFELDSEATISIEMPVVITPATVYVRMKDNLSAGFYSGILNANAGDIPANVRLSGQVSQGASASQTISLYKGWNWWSTNLDITLEQLEEALGTNGVMIKSQTEYATFNGTTWDNSDITSDLDVKQMYKIRVNANCEITVTGTVVNPADCNITLYKGYNWIGYPCSQPLSLSEAFGSGFTPTAGDLIKSDNGYAIYNGTSWECEGLDAFEPGKGYIYKSNATGTKSFTFGTSSKGTATLNNTTLNR